MKTIKLILKFVGTNYCGWQVQKNGITVQQCLNEAVSKVTGEKISTVGCGRTDSGVHAEAYVASFKTKSTIPPERFSYALNAFLPEDIVCVHSEVAEDDFDAGRSAIKKTYTYRIFNSEFNNPFYEPFTYHIKAPLDVEAMRSAARHFCGTHDFFGFAAAGFSVKTTVRTIYSLNISEKNNIINIEVTGDGFLYNMVRIIAGTLVFCGIHKIKPDEIPDIIASKDRSRAGITAPAKGLFLTEVFY